jgi:hypothetical protein
MSNAEATDLTDVLGRVKTWPPTLRITLARKILESLDKAEAPAASPAKTRGFSTAEAYGLAKTNRPSPMTIPSHARGRSKACRGFSRRTRRPRPMRNAGRSSKTKSSRST